MARHILMCGVTPTFRDILQHTATHCNTLQHTTYLATHSDVWRDFHMLRHTATHCNTLQHTAIHCNTLQHTATHCNTLRHTATHCNTLNTLQHTATHCNTLHTLTHSPMCGVTPSYRWHVLFVCVPGLHRRSDMTPSYSYTHTTTHCNTLQHTATHCNTLYLHIAAMTPSHV